jgi:hypothetical protein
MPEESYRIGTAPLYEN